MRKIYWRPLLLVVALLLAFASPVMANPMLHTDKTRIVDAQGEPVYLRGVNLGGWLHWEGWIFGGNLFLSESLMLQRLATLTSKTEADAFYHDVHDNMITEADIAKIASLGFNTVRVPFNHRLLEEDATPYVYKERGWQTLDRLLNWCDKYQVYVVLDMHSAPGGQASGAIFDSGGWGQKIWENAANRKRTVALWKAIAHRYKDREIIAGYDLLNEPSTPSQQTLAGIYKELATAIRTEDTQHIIFIEGGNFAQNFSQLEKPFTTNQALSFHMYNWFGDDRKKKLTGYRKLVETTGMPLWNGEGGENNLAMLTSTYPMYEDSQYRLSGWTFWTWKKVKNNMATLVEVNNPASWKKVMNWMMRPNSKKPTRAEALQGMNAFVHALRYEENIVHDETARALIPKP